MSGSLVSLSVGVYVSIDVCVRACISRGGRAQRDAFASCLQTQPWFLQQDPADGGIAGGWRGGGGNPCCFRKAKLGCRAEHVIQENERLAGDSLSDGCPNSIGTKRRANNRKKPYTPFSFISLFSLSESKEVIIKIKKWDLQKKLRLELNIMFKTTSSRTKSLLDVRPL